MTSPTTAGTGCSPHTLQDRRPASPAAYLLSRSSSSCRRARPRYAQAARAQSPSALIPPTARPRAGVGGAVPHRRPGSAADHWPATADAGALAPGGVPARGGAAPSLARSHSGGPARVCCRRGGSRAYRLRPGAADPARPPENLARARSDPRSSRPAFPRLPGAPTLARRSCRAESGKAPPCMRWRGLARPRRAGWPVAWSSPRAAPPAGARYPREGPVSRLLPRSRRRPRMVPVSSGESIITTAASTAQGPAASHFLFSRYPRKTPQKAGSYPHFTAVIHGFTHSLPTGHRM